MCGVDLGYRKLPLLASHSPCRCSRPLESNASCNFLWNGFALRCDCKKRQPLTKPEGNLDAGLDFQELSGPGGDGAYLLLVQRSRCLV